MVTENPSNQFESTPESTVIPSPKPVQSIPKLLKIVVIAQAVIIISLLSLFVYFTVTGTSFKKEEINSYEECVAAGNPVMDSYPEQCITKDKKSFTRQLSEEEQKKLKPPVEETQSTESAAMVETESLLPATKVTTPSGVKHSIPKIGWNFYLPSGWKSSLEEFSDEEAYLVRFWQGSSPQQATMQLNIKPNWDNTGDAQSLPRNFIIAEGIKAARAEPPTLEEQKLDRYQTNYYFEYQQQVYVLACVHNWIPELVTECDNLLKTMQPV